MSRDWLSVYPGMLASVKYRRTSILARAALFHLWLLAGWQSPEATWRDLDELAELLELDGYPVETVHELVARGWIDVLDDGRIAVHDWDEHQYAATDQIKRTYERERKQDWRKKRRSEPENPLSLASLSPVVEEIRKEETRVSRDVPKSPGHVRDTPYDGSLSDTTTCPFCGDGPLEVGTNVTQDRHGQKWHIQCPDAPSFPIEKVIP